MEKWSPQKIKLFQEKLLDWYDQEGRDLPWRKDHDPYHVWVSEIMLQQTQVKTVIPYYQRFMTLFPTVSALAAAPEDQLLKAWEGLGYYSRVRNMQKAAQQIMADYGGQWPNTAAELQKLSGIGPYTAGAIASIAFDEKVPAIDSNAFRVFSRLFEVDVDITKPQAQPVFYSLIEEVMPAERPGDFNQAIMDLGSSYMTAKNPDSEHSPVKEFNQAYLDGKELAYPVRTKKPRPVPVNYVALVIKTPQGYLLEQRSSKGMLANLWTFPLVKWQDLSDDEDLKTVALPQLATDYLVSTSNLRLKFRLLPAKIVTHTFTHQKWSLTLLFAETTTKQDLSFFPGRLIKASDFASVTWPKVQQKLWDEYQKSLSVD
ncbi:A/G-specific adenine glycosylase [Loigolactobacillus backii]|uniref:A/G-specific adenine glycosylase n=1 Tax=Loigolactobacillus backii TaxID=375175 RepID=UPI0007F0A133|nr:A/G-specific adenine glycosylase [Loigolactobacillus backii]ANK60448.1 A/G-specific adenine glycosylase [Loigolactobacillus backii]